MEMLHFVYPAGTSVRQAAQAGVVGSGNLEVLMEPSDAACAAVEVTTSQDGNREIWDCVLSRFFQEYPVCVRLEINDFGATPGVVQLRLLQVLELAQEETEEKGGEAG